MDRKEVIHRVEEHRKSDYAFVRYQSPVLMMIHVRAMMKRIEDYRISLERAVNRTRYG